jgi:hypothetical protein
MSGILAAAVPVVPLLLSDLARRALGLSRAASRDIERASLAFAAPWGATALALTLAGAALWFAVQYLRDGSKPSWWVKGPLLFLRLVAVAALVAMLLEPTLRVTQTSSQRPTVVLLLDDSLSMGRRDARLPEDRASRLRRVLEADPRSLTRDEIVSRLFSGPVLASLSARFNLKAYAFGADARPLTIGAKPAPPRLAIAPDPVRGNSTQMGEALRRALDDVAGQPVAAVIVAGDGGHNLGENPLTQAKRAREQGIAVSTIGIGDPTPTRDVAVTEALADQVVRKDNVVQVFAGIAHRGYQGRAVTVSLRRGDGITDTKVLTLGASDRKQTVSFTYTPKHVGSYTCTVSVQPLAGETTLENNRRSFLQRVVSKRLKILYVESEPRWEYRYLKNAILRDEQIRFSCILTEGGAQAGGEGNAPVDRFPADERSLFEYDILMLGDVPRSYFSDAQLAAIRRFVEDRGGSLIVIAGEKHMPSEYRGTPIEAVLPVVVPPVPEQVVTDEPFPIVLTPEGRQDPLLRLAADPNENARIWSSLPGHFWQAGVPRAKPGATVLAVNGARSNANGPRVVIAVQPFGAGRCLVSLVDSTWRWRFRVGDRYFYRYWGQAIRAMTPHETPGGNRFAQVNADRSEYLLGDRISVFARLLDAFYRPIKADRVVANLTGETGVVRSVTLQPVPGSPGLFSADLIADGVGKFTLGVASPANPGAKATATYLVQSVALEQQQPELNERLMREIAAVGGGRYVAPDGLRAWADGLRSKSLAVRRVTEIEIWDAPVLLLLIVLPLALEWFVRKRSGLL